MIDSAECDGSSSSIVAQTTCTVQVATLRAAPFNIAWGSSVYARIIATNYLGSSVASEAGNGAIILTYPDEPINLTNNLESNLWNHYWSYLGRRRRKWRNSRY